MFLAIQYFDGFGGRCAQRRVVSFAASFSCHFVGLPFWNPEQEAPVEKTQRLSINGDEIREPSISRLLFFRRPSAILGRIRAIVIDAVNGMKFCRPLSHVSKKVLKTIAPAFTNIDAARPIDWKLVVIGVEAALFNGGPSNVFRAMAQIMRSRVGIAAQQRGRCFEGKTATACRRFAEVGGSHLRGIAAFALAQPKYVPIASTAWYPLYDHQATCTLASQVKGRRHDFNLAFVPNTR